MTKKVIHGHNSVGLGSTFPLFLLLLRFSLSFQVARSFFFLFGCMAIYRKSHLVQGKLAQASCLLRAECISSPRRVAYLGLKFSLSSGELDASLGEFRVRNLHEKTILPFLLGLFLDLTNNHQNQKKSNKNTNLNKGNNDSNLLKLQYR